VESAYANDVTKKYGKIRGDYSVFYLGTCLLSLVGWDAQQYIDEQKEQTTLFTEEQISIAGQPAIQLETTFWQREEIYGRYAIQALVTDPETSKVITIRFVDTTVIANASEFKFNRDFRNIYGRILSTFRFVDTNEQVVEVDLSDGNYANLNLNIYSNEIPESQRKLYIEEACVRTKWGYARSSEEGKNCSELPVLNAPEWTALIATNPSVVGLFYQNHFLRIETNFNLTRSSKVRIISPRSFLVMQSVGEGLVSADVASLEAMQPLWYPNKGMLPSPKIQRNELLYTFAVEEIPKDRFLVGISPVLVRATFTDGSVKEESFAATKESPVGTSSGYVLSSSFVALNNTEQLKLTAEKLAQPDSTDFIAYVSNGDIYRTNLEKTELVRLTDHKGVARLRVSPDQKYIAYTEYRGYLSHPGAIFGFGGDFYFKIIDAEDGRLIRLRVFKDRSGSIPYENFFWADNGSKVYFSMKAWDWEEGPFYASYSIAEGEDIISEELFESVKQANNQDSQILSESEQAVLFQAADELLGKLNFKPLYLQHKWGAGFSASPDASKIMFALPPPICDSAPYEIPLLIYDLVKKQVFIVDGLSFGWEGLGIFESKWINNNNLIFSEGTLKRIDFTTPSLSSFVEVSGSASECYELLGPSVNTLCDQGLQFFSFTPMLRDPCSA